MLEGFHQRLARVLHDLHRVAHDEGADSGAADDHQFVGLDQNVDVAAHGHEAAENAADRDYKSYDNIHLKPASERFLSVEPIEFLACVRLYQGHFIVRQP
ncbi:hypothetical protein D3C87_1801500 [compost metagenome]